MKVATNPPQEAMWALSQPIFNLDYRPPAPDPCLAIEKRRSTAAGQVNLLQRRFERNPEDEELLRQLEDARDRLEALSQELKRCRDQRPG